MGMVPTYDVRSTASRYSLCSTSDTTIHAFRLENNVGVSSQPMNDTRVLCLKQTNVTLLPKKSTMKIQLRRSRLIQKKAVRMVKKESKGSLLVLYRSSYPAPACPYYMVANSTCGQLKRENRSCLRKWFRAERGSAVQSRVSPFHSPQSDREEPGSFRDGVHLCHQPPSGQSRVYRVTQLRTDTPVLSTCSLHTNSGCGKERRILIAPR